MVVGARTVPIESKVSECKHRQLHQLKGYAQIYQYYFYLLIQFNLTYFRQIYTSKWSDLEIGSKVIDFKHREHKKSATCRKSCQKMSVKLFEHFDRL